MLKDNNEPLTFIQHLEELRRRIIVCLAVIFITGIFCFFYVDKILILLSKFTGGKLVFIKPAEAFITKIKVAFYGGVFISMPVVIYQIWAFVSPALLELERKVLSWVIPFSYLLFLLGVAFAFFCVLPIGMKFLLNCGTEYIQPMISVSSYVSFVVIFLLSFGLIFQLPLIVLILTELGIVTPQLLVRQRKYAILVIFTIAGIVTPGPDVFSQFLMAIPTLLLYEVSILLSKFIFSAKKKTLTK